MSTEELLFPRYKVIAIWPGMHLEPFALHQVVTLQPHKEEDTEGFIYIPYKHKPKNFMWESFFTLFPHLFKKLEWWEGRKPDEMPEYVKYNDGIYKVEKPLTIISGYIYTEGEVIEAPLKQTLPATLAEYEQYTNQNEKQ